MPRNAGKPEPAEAAFRTLRASRLGRQFQFANNSASISGLPIPRAIVSAISRARCAPCLGHENKCILGAHVLRHVV